MAITDELRKWAACELSYKTRFDALTAIADRIDAAYEEALSTISRAAQLLADAEKDRDENYANWQDCKQKALHHAITIDERDAEIERLKDELAHCVKPPKDADGEYIHIGDVVESDHYEGGTVMGVQYFRAPNGATHLLIAVRPFGWDTSTWLDPLLYRHPKPDSWERIAADFMQWHVDGHDADEREQLIARCKALAGEDE